MNALSNDFLGDPAPLALALPDAPAAGSLGPQPLVRTGRLTLRRPGAGDAAAIAAALARARAQRADRG